MTRLMTVLIALLVLGNTAEAQRWITTCERDGAHKYCTTRPYQPPKRPPSKSLLQKWKERR